QLGSLPRETLIRGHPHLDIEVALAPARRPGVAGSRDPHSLTVLDPGRDVDLPGAHLRDAARAAAALARCLGDAAVSPAPVAGHRPDDLAEDAPAHLPDLARALALRAGLDRGAGLGPVAAASLADAHGLDGDLPLLILEHVLELDLDDRPDVRA